MAGARALVADIEPKSHADGAIAELAGRQHGVVSRRELFALGLGSGAIAHRLACGRLHQVRRGVYAVGHRVLSRDGRWTAALLSVGSDAVLSHRTAAAVWGIRRTSPPRIDVTVPRALHARRDIRLYRTVLADDETTTLRGMRVTTPTRTLLDLAAAVSRAELEKALNEAEVQRLTDQVPLTALLERHGKRPGIATLRAILADTTAGTTITRSDLEDDFLAFVKAEGLPRPQVNAILALDGRTMEVDCLWRDRRLIAELDGRTAHGTRAAFERDRARDRALQAHGWRVVRITWRALHAEPHRVSADLGRLLRPQLP